MRRQFDNAPLTQFSCFQGFKPDFGSFANIETPAVRETVVNVLTSVVGSNRLIGSVMAAPSRPPVAAVESLLAHHLGSDKFSDDLKKLIGRLTRQVIEHLGGRWVRRGVPVTVPSRFSKGSIYTF